MRITEAKLRSIIREEIRQSHLNEGVFDFLKKKKKKRYDPDAEWEKEKEDQAEKAHQEKRAKQAQSHKDKMAASDRQQKSWGHGQTQYSGEDTSYTGAPKKRKETQGDINARQKYEKGEEARKQRWD